MCEGLGKEEIRESRIEERQRCGQRGGASLLCRENAGHHHHYLSLSLSNFSKQNEELCVCSWVWVGYLWVSKWVLSACYGNGFWYFWLCFDLTGLGFGIFGFHF